MSIKDRVKKLQRELLPVEIMPVVLVRADGRKEMSDWHEAMVLLIKQYDDDGISLRCAAADEIVDVYDPSGRDTGTTDGTLQNSSSIAILRALLRKNIHDPDKENTLEENR